MIGEASRAIREQATLAAMWAGRASDGTLISAGQMSPGGAHTTLFIAEPMYVSSAVCDLIFSASHSVPPWGLRPEDLFTPYGFVWFAKPYHGPAPSGNADVVRIGAVSWGVIYNADTDEEIMPLPPGLAPLNTRDGIRLCFWAYGAAGRLSMRVGDLSWRFGQSHVTCGPNRFENEQGAVWTIVRRHLPLLSALFAFVRQRVLVLRRQGGDRASRRAAQQAGVTPRECNIIVLRRAQSCALPTNGSQADTPWSCRWWVAGHWRQQPCGEGRAERRPTWITPYIKGPEDKPVKPTSRLFAAIR